MMKKDTIAAIATAMTPSGIGIIRISGEEALQIIDKIYRSKGGKKKISSCESHTIHYGYIVDHGEIIDEVMVLLMKAPNTYTREDTIEIDCHGGVYVMQRILETVIAHGARPAEPGEFTKRAFLNGRIDLSQAESVIDVINSKNEFALKSSISQLKGSVKKEIRLMRADIIHEIAFIESALDDPEHISLESYPLVLNNVVDNLLKSVKKLLNNFDNGRILKEGIRTAIVGKPNAGKSSLLNTLLGENRAIVTDIAGTTRDVLEEQITLGGISLTIMDTAGIRQTEDIVEKIGVDKAREAVDLADLVIFVMDSSKDPDTNDYEIMQMLQNRKAIVLLNKSDLCSVVDAEQVRGMMDQTGCAADIPVLTASMKESKGVEELINQMKEMFFHGDISFNDEVYITNIRQKTALLEVQEALLMVKQSIEDNMPEDFFSIDLMSAYEALGRIIGEAVEDDLVNEIFSKFCMGK